MPTTLESSIAESTLRPGDEEGSGDKREIGADAVWTLSTAKPGNGVEQLRFYWFFESDKIWVDQNQFYRDNNTETYWQSDGPQPHLVNIQFHKKMLIKEIAIYCDHKHDESYTPSKLSIRAGTHFHDLQEVKEVTLEEPSGWIRIPLRKSDLHRPGTVTCSGGNIVAETDTNECLRAFMLQVAILANHENGRDSHIRQIKVFAPRPAGGSGGIGLWTGLGEGEDCFSTPQFAVMSLIR